MNNEIKLNLSVVLPGRTMYSQKQAKAAEKEKLGNGFEKFSMSVSDNRKDREVIHTFLRKAIPASQSLNLGKESYECMISNQCPYFCKPKQWNALNTKARLEAHLEKICESFNGISYTYVVFED